MELKHFPSDLPACTRKELGEGALMYQFKKDEHAQLLLKHLADMQANEILTDLTVRTKLRDFEEPFHTVLLAANSPLIRRRLTGKCFDCTQGVIELDLTRDQIEAFRDFVYKSKLPADHGMAKDFQHFASTYEMTYLKELCQNRAVQRESLERMTVLSMYQKDAFSQLHDMLQKKELTTTVLEDCDGSSQFAVHGPILAAASPIFQDMFSSDLLSQEGSRYRLKDVACITLGDLIEFIYTGEVTLEEENVVDLLQAARNFEIPTLARACCDWLEMQLRPYNAIGIWLLARTPQSEYTSVLEEVANGFIIANFISVCTEDEFLELEHEDLEEIIRNDYLSVENEEEVFTAIVNWMKAGKDRSSFFCDLLQCVRLEHACLEFLYDVEKDPHVAKCMQCLQIVQRAQAKKIQISNSTPEGTRWNYGDIDDIKRNLLDEFLESTPFSHHHLNQASENTLPREPRKSTENDMRLKENRHGQLNKDGSPDMRFKVQRRHLKQKNVDGTPDRRYRENKENNRSTQGNVSTTKGPLTKNGSPDMRFKVNKETYRQSTSLNSRNTPQSESKRTDVPLKKDGTPDMRYTVNKTPETVNSALSGNGATPLKKDGTPDMRFAVNKPARKPASPAQISRFPLTSSSCKGPLKKDGTPDMRFTSNKQSPSSMSSLSSESRPNGPLKKDGTPDMRYTANKSFYDSASSTGLSSGGSYHSTSSLASLGSPGPLKSNGTPDMRFASNRSFYGSSSTYGGSSYSSRSSSSGSSFGGSTSCGPLKSNGTPDMRFKANRS